MKSSLIAVALASIAATPAMAADAGAADSGAADSGVSATDTIVVTATPDTAQATATIQRTAGGVEVVPDTAFKHTPVQNIKDILGYVPGVIVQPRMGDDARVAIVGFWRHPLNFNFAADCLLQIGSNIFGDGLCVASDFNFNNLGSCFAVC